MRFGNFRFRTFIQYFIPALIYPVWAYVSSGGKLIRLMDAMTVTGLVFLILGVVFSMVRLGDFDIVGYVARRTVQKGDVKPFRAYLEDKREERKRGMNYPLLTGAVLLAASALLSLVY